MGFDFKRKIYDSLPISIRRGICLVPFPWLAGKSYRKVFERGGFFDRATRKEILQYQERELGSVLRFAVEQVPAYTHLKRIVDSHPPFEALKAFPLMDKATIQANPTSFLPKDFEKIPHYETSTGGTTGNQLKIFLDDDSQSVEMGFMHRQWRRVGYSPSHRKATFRGVKFQNLEPGVFWQHNPIYNELQFSPFQMHEGTLSSYVEEILKFAPTYFHGYPSAIDILADFVLRQGYKGQFTYLKAILLGSEGASEMQRERISQAFGARVYTWYGQSERVVLAGECEKNSSYHSMPDYGILELISESGDSLMCEGDRGEIVGTGFFNRCMPLIRYRTGDFATRLDPFCECGRCWDRMIDVEGRWKQDMIVGRNGSKISLAALNMHGPIFEKVIRYQYFQDTIGHCELKLQVAPGFTKQDQELIADAYKVKLGDEVRLAILLVPEIPLTARGKLKLLDSKLTNAPGYVPQGTKLR